MKFIALATIMLASSLASAETFRVDTAGSALTWKGTKITGASHNGQVKLKNGTLEVDKGKIKGGSFEIDLDTITNEDLASSPEYHAKLLGHLKDVDFFDIKKYPTSKFVIEKVTPVKGDEYTVSGKLTIKDATKPLSFPATIKFAKDSAEAEGTLKFDRTVWGLKYGSGKFFKDLGDKVIKDEIEMGLKLKAAK